MARGCAVKDDSALYAARLLVREVAPGIGFGREVTEELVVVVSELVSNILKYGVRGRVEVEAFDEDGVRGIVITAADESPPFDLGASMRDGYDANGRLDPALVYGRGGIGAGLGAVSRLSDSVEQVTTATGKAIVARRLLVSRPRRGSRPSF